MEKKVIVITGTPGVGKSTLARVLAAKLGWERLDLHAHYKKISVGYDARKHCYVVDVRKLEKLVREKLKTSGKGLILDSHIAHLLPRRLVRLCIVLVCSDLKLILRWLKRRGYSKAKIRENLDAEIFQHCLLEAKEKGHKVMVFDTARQSVQQILPKCPKSL